MSSSSWGFNPSTGSSYPLDKYATNVEIDDGDYDDDVDMVGTVKGKRGLEDEITPAVANKVMHAVSGALSTNLAKDLGSAPPTPRLVGKYSFMS